MEEVWKDIRGYEGYYQISSCGRVRSLNYNHTGKTQIIKPCKNTDGYLLIGFCKNGKHKLFSIHRLVAQAFIPNPYNLPECNHKDENPLNNCVENIEWCDHNYNINYGTRNERVSKALTNHPLKSKPVAAYKDGVEIMRFASSREAQRNGYNQQCVGYCCRGLYKQYKGYEWKYV